MVATLQSRKEALEAKLRQKNEELKKLCMQEAELTGVIPPEIPLEPGESPPQLRRRVGTSFSFPQNLINQIKNADDESLTALELECKVQTNIAQAALTLANDTNTSKSVRKKHRLMYRKSQTRLMELETRLSLLRQGKSQSIKQLHAKKKPRPASNAENLLPGNSEEQYNKNMLNVHSTWALKALPGYSTDEVDHIQDISILHNHRFGSLQHSRRSSATSKSSGSPRIDRGSIEELRASANQLYHGSSITQMSMLPSFSQPDIQGIHTEELRMNDTHHQHHHHPRRGIRRGTVAGTWDTVSAGGTLLPSQTYPDHSHHPSLNRTQSLGSVEANAHQNHRENWVSEEPKKEKEWYETSLDSAPSPPIRTSSRLPPAMRILQNLKEAHMKDATYNPGMKTHLPYPTTNSHPILARTNHIPTHFELKESLDSQMSDLTINHIRDRSKGFNENSNHDYIMNSYNQDVFRVVKSPQVYSQQDFSVTHKYLNSQALIPNKREHEDNWTQPVQQYHSKPDVRYTDKNQRQRCDSVIINMPEDVSDYQDNSRNEIKFESTNQKNVPPEQQTQSNVPKLPTQAYYHTSAISNHDLTDTEPKSPHRSNDISIHHQSIQSLPNHHPPHAITQSEVVFDTVVPFESPQNHTVIQAGKWQPYREVTKPFEMSDFYKYSTKFRQSKTPVPEHFRAQTPLDFQRNSPSLISSTHQKGIYQPLRPMSCQPLDSKIIGEHVDQSLRHLQEEAAEISKPEIV